MTDKTKISIVVPVYNSGTNITELVEQLVNVFKTLSEYSLELILINDGSSDNSWEVLTQEKNKFPDVEWSSIIGFRNLLIHEYFRIEAAELWQTILKDLPALKIQMKDILKTLK